MGFSKQEYWRELPYPPPGHVPDPGTEPRSPALQADSLPCEPPGKPNINIKEIKSYIVIKRYLELPFFTLSLARTIGLCLASPAA